MNNQSNITKTLILDLLEDIKELQKLESNIEVIWALEKLHTNNAIIMTANFIRKEMRQKAHTLG
tara:strand:- start:58 stop:249 length:192 start_codon:yes stop_codon:yes gene_type:complete